MSKPDDLPNFLVAHKHDSKLVCVIETGGHVLAEGGGIVGRDLAVAGEAVSQFSAPAGAGRSLARGYSAGNADNHAHKGGFMIQTGRVLAGPAAPGTGD
jgi:hypothetical protein